MSCLYFLEPENRYGHHYFSFAKSFRQIAFEIDEHPESIKKYSSLPAIDFLLSDKESTTLDRTHYLEAFAYGDPGVLLASPGPSLSGLVLRELGLPEQVDHFYNILKKQTMRTFFAMTEPDKGSDATQIKTLLTKMDISKKNYILRGKKCFFGNGAVAEMGVALAKIASSPAGIRAVWLTPELLTESCVSKYTLPMSSLRGAQIAVMSFDDLKIPHENILGHHRSSCENGLLSIIKVFNRLRTGVGALAIGQAQAVYDITFLINHDKVLPRESYFSDLNDALESARYLLHSAARKVDENALNGTMASLAKANATDTAEKVISQCVDICTMDDLLQNPWILKAYRDVFSWEYMEGTSHIQKKQISKNMLQLLNELNTKPIGVNNDNQ